MKPLRNAHFVFSIIFLLTTDVQGQVEKWEASLIEDAAFLAICEDVKILDLAGLNKDSCIDETRRHSNQCWTHLNSVIGTRNESPIRVVPRRNKQEHANIVWLFARCIQASVLLPHTSPSNIAKIEKADMQSGQDAELDGLATVVSNSELNYRNVRQDFVAMQEMLSKSGHVSVFKISKYKVSAVDNDGGEMIIVRPDDPEEWVDLLDRSLVNSITRQGSEYQFKHAPTVSASKHEIEVVFVHSPANTLTECRPDSEFPNCGSCDVTVDDDAVARITWFSRQISGSTGGVKTNEMGESNSQEADDPDDMECWLDGMKQIGYSESELLR